MRILSWPCLESYPHGCHVAEAVHSHATPQECTDGRRGMATGEIMAWHHTLCGQEIQEAAGGCRRYPITLCIPAASVCVIMQTRTRQGPSCSTSIMALNTDSPAGERDMSEGWPAYDILASASGRDDPIQNPTPCCAIEPCALLPLNRGCPLLYRQISATGWDLDSVTLQRALSVLLEGSVCLVAP